MHIVYGGSFNPPTKAHLEIYKTLKRKLPVSQFTFLPVGKAYQKETLQYATHRYNMLSVMTKSHEDIYVSDIELNDQTFKGTYVSLNRLNRHNEAMAFIIGADNLMGLHRWKNIHKMISQFKCIVLNRHQKDLSRFIKTHPELSYLKDQFIIIEDFNQTYSSSAFRETRNESLLTPSVIKYIKQHNLY